MTRIVHVTWNCDFCEGSQGTTSAEVIQQGLPEGWSTIQDRLCCDRHDILIQPPVVGRQGRWMSFAVPVPIPKDE